METRVVTAYGVTLDAGASPQDVAFVLLQSLRDDVEAAQAHERDKQREAFWITFALAAHRTIEERILTAAGAKATEADRQRLADTLRKQVYDVVNHWAPIVGHYVAGFDRDRGALQARMTVQVQEASKTARISLESVHDPAQTDAALIERAIFDIDLVQVEGPSGGELWRVVRVAPRGSEIPLVKPATQPAIPPAATAPAVAPVGSASEPASSH